MRVRLAAHRVARRVRRARACIERVLLMIGVRLRMKSSLRAAAELHRLAALAAAWPTDTRRVFTVHKVYDLALPEIATRLQLSERAVEQHLVTASLLFSGCIDLSESVRRAGITRRSTTHRLDLSELDPPPFSTQE